MCIANKKVPDPHPKLEGPETLQIVQGEGEIYLKTFEKLSPQSGGLCLKTYFPSPVLRGINY